MRAVAVDGAGAMVSAGDFRSPTATFGGVVLTNAGQYDAVLWKQSAEGTTLWAVRGGGTSSDYLYGVAVDGAGSVVAAGHFKSSSATFGGVALTTAESYRYDAVVWKMSAEGTTLWAMRGGGRSTDQLYGVAVDDAGAVVAAGYFRSSSATFGGVALTNTGGSDAVVWKMTSEGTTLWAARGGGSSYDYMRAVAVDGAGGVVAAGYFSGSTATFGRVSLTNDGSNDVALWKLSFQGTTLWGARGGGTSNDYLHGVAVDSVGAVVAAGYFQSSPATFGGVVLTNAENNAIMWKLSAEGTTLWAVSGGGNSEADYDWMTVNDIMNGVAVDAVNAVVVAGSLANSPATFGDRVLTKVGTGSSGDAVLWKLNAEGTTLWAIRAGGTSSDQLHGVAVDGAGASVAAGSFYSSPAMFEGVNLTTAGSNDAVVWKVSDGAGSTYSSNHVLLNTATLSPSFTSSDSPRPSRPLPFRSVS